MKTVGDSKGALHRGRGDGADRGERGGRRLRILAGVLASVAFLATAEWSNGADLIAESVGTCSGQYGYDTTDYMTAGGTYYLHAEFSWTGLGAFTNWHGQWLLDDNPIWEAGGYDNGGYSAGSYESTIISPAFVAPAGTHALTFVVDNRDEIAESDVANNIIIRNFTVGGPWAGATDAGNGWMWLSWFGYFQNPGGGWIYHLEHGWLYCLATSNSSIWLWSSRLGWVWTSSTVYPFLWSDTRQTWLFYYRGTGTPAGGWFYNYGAGSTAWL